MAKVVSYRRGDKGIKVKQIQEALVKTGYLKPEDVVGNFGPTTEKAVIAFQKAKKLVADGVVGEATQISLGIHKLEEVPAWKLTEKDITDAAKSLGVSVALMHAIAEVESAGDGFQPDGKMKILYERHIFRRMARERGLDLLADAAEKVYPDICNRETGGYLGGAKEWQRLEKAQRIHKEIALESASYGRFQLMGFRYVWCGFHSASEMVTVLSKNEGNQLKAVVNFIKAQPELLEAAQKEDMLQFALIYNGPKQQGYDVKLKAALERYRALGHK